MPFNTLRDSGHDGRDDGGQPHPLQLAEENAGVEAADRRDLDRPPRVAFFSPFSNRRWFFPPEEDEREGAAIAAQNERREQREDDRVREAAMTERAGVGDVQREADHVAVGEDRAGRARRHDGGRQRRTAEPAPQRERHDRV